MVFERFSFRYDSLAVLHWIPRHGDKIDTVARATEVWKVVSQVCSIDADSFSVWEAAHTFPHDLVVPKRWPTVGNTFLDEIFKRSSLRSYKQELACIGIVKFNLSIGFKFFPSFLDKWSALPVSTVFRIVSVKVANSVSYFPITIPAEIFLNWGVGCSYR